MAEEALLPPPRKPDATPLSNADFRKFLDTPRRETAEPNRAKQQRQKAGGDSSGQHAKPKRSHKGRTKPDAATEAKDEELYRDRAEERRKGLNIDYEGAALPNTLAANQHAISVEDSKFLGGDVEHTHLVKGLDFQLLQKVKEELVKPGAAGKDARPKAVVEKKQEAKFATPFGRAVFKAVFEEKASDASISFLPRRLAFVYDLEEDAANDLPTTLRRSLLDCPKPVETITATVDAPVLERLAKIMSHMRVAGGGKRLKRKDKLRMLEALDAQQQQQQHSQQPASGPPPPQHQANGAEKAASAVRPAEEDDDIFADAGTDYQLQAKPKGEVRPQGSYFGQDGEMLLPPPPPPAANDTAEGDDMELDEAAVPPPPPGPPPEGSAAGPSLPPAGYDREAAYAQMNRAANQGYEAYIQANVAYQASQDPEYQALLARQQAEAGGAPASQNAGQALTQEQREAGLASVFRRDDDQGKRRDVDARERDPDFAPDAYAECYPDYHGYAHAIVDSDEEDLSHMDSKEKGKGRTDFETEEQYETYKSRKEAAPKAAFQFGLKVADGRKAHKDLGNKAREQKFNNQLNQIQKKLEADGGNYGSAFAPAMTEEGGAQGATKKRRI
ncbi:hypothetical protein WJX73_007555 [Symbiochloris irregularis]|uniref:RED-like N-terminal domain-containing protein n=1 Tax=Symbiochloris irregularis TaxID=706552 RepID=A0AAW1P5T4_9CHLO